MIKRLLEARILESLAAFPVVGLVGSRQVGKTTLAARLAKRHRGKVHWLDLEMPSDLDKLERAELYLEERADALVILDEIQRKPELFPLLRALVDRHRRPGRFLILGSASPALIRHASESLAGRIIYHELGPLHMRESGGVRGSFRALWLRGGYPLSYLASDDLASLRWRRAFIQTYLERDVPGLGFRISPVLLRRFWMMLAHSHGQLWNASRIAAGLGISAPTAAKYLDLLEETFLVRRLLPYHANLGKRLTKSPKVYFRDPGLLHALHDLSDFEALQGHPIAGPSWEGFVLEQVLAQLPPEWQAHFFRTQAGAEIDLVLVPPIGRPIAVEAKYSLSPKPERGFWTAFSDLKCQAGFVVYPGREAYSIHEKVRALPIHRVEEIFQ